MKKIFPEIQSRSFVEYFVEQFCGFGVSKIEPLFSSAYYKKRLMKANRELPPGSIPSVVKV